MSRLALPDRCPHCIRLFSVCPGDPAVGAVGSRTEQFFLQLSPANLTHTRAQSDKHMVSSLQPQPKPAETLLLSSLSLLFSSFSFSVSSKRFHRLHWCECLGFQNVKRERKERLYNRTTQKTEPVKSYSQLEFYVFGNERWLV